MFSDDDSDHEDKQHILTINEHYAKAYEYRKDREELSKLKDKYGSDAESDNLVDSSDDSEDETEDEDGEELTAAVDAAIFRTLAKIKRKDPDIYDDSKDVFEEEQRQTGDGPKLFRAPKDKSKPLLMRQHIINSTLRSSRSPSPQPAVPTHAEEEEALRKQTISAFHNAVAADDSDDDLLIPREKTKDELELEEEEYRTYLEQAVGEDLRNLVTVEEGQASSSRDVLDSGEIKQEDKTSKDAKKKKKKGKSKKTQEESDHDFLMNYILNRGWIDKNARHIPTYSEVTGSSQKPKKSSKVEETKTDGDSLHMENAGDAEDDFDEEAFDEVVDTFESSYNFRFEEPNAAVIPTHPRTLPSLVRRPDTTRKEARERKKERKAEKLLQKKEEVKRLKALKMKELRERLERVGAEGGEAVDEEALAELDLDGEWDPDKHDQQMAGIYNDEVEEGDIEQDMEKPVWKDDIDISNIMPSSSKHSKKKADDEAMDVDLPEMNADENTLQRNKKRKFDASMDAMYDMEFNDMVGDLPTRFKYTPVLPQTYGLSPVEILIASDKELNEFMSVKKYAPYRKSGIWDSNRGARLKELKDKLKQRTGGDLSTLSEPKQKKRKGKKERQKAKMNEQAAEGAEEDIDMATSAMNESNKEDQAMNESEAHAKKKRRRQKKASTAVDNMEREP